MSRKGLVTSRAAGMVRLAGILVLGCSWLAAQQKPADLILRNGKVLTVDKNFSIAQAIAVTGNTISAVGQDADVMKLAGPNTQVIDVKGRTIIPGLMDTHLHYTGMDYGASLPEPLRAVYRVDWRGVRTKEDVLSQIAGVIKKYDIKPGEWIHFENQLGFSGEGSPEIKNQSDILFNQLNRWELDKAAPNNPIIMSEGIPEYNGLLVNGVAMDILWKEYGDFIKKNGRYWIDNTGRPDGHLESVATRPLMMKWEPQPTAETLAPLFRMTQEDLASIGQTTDSGRYPIYRVAGLKLLEQRGQLMERTAYGAEEDFGMLKDPNVELKKDASVVGTGTDMIWITSVAPSSVDGTGSRACTNQSRNNTGAIDYLYPVGQCYQDSEYKGAAGHAASISGNYYHDWVMASAKYGVRFANTHMSGDRSVAQFIKMVAEAQKQYGKDSTKYWGSDHCNLVNPADLPEAAKLGIYFSCQANIGAGVVEREYGDKIANSFPSPVQTMMNLGINVSLEGEGGRAWIGIERLITRKDPQGKVWAPQERLTRQEALTMATRNGANYVLRGDKLGSLEPGKWADIVVLDQDYLTMPEDQIHAMAPQVTILNGKIIFVHRDFSQEYNLTPPGAVISTNKELVSRKNGLAGGGG
jgi:predicted amidohydrolase YtcJ